MTVSLFQGWRQSLQWRVLLATLAGVSLALVLAGLLLNSLFRDHVTRQFQAELALHLEQLTARLEFDAQGQPVIDATGLSDPRWHKPYSGRYWQVDSHAVGRSGPSVPAAVTASQAGVLRSRSLWDHTLHMPDDVVADGAVHVHWLLGPSDQPLLALERTVHTAEGASGGWMLVVAADARETEQAMHRFAGVLFASLAVLLLLLGLAAVAQVWVGLSPLRVLQKAVVDLGLGRTTRLQGAFPVEIQPLVHDFNRTLERQEDGLMRARTQAGNLAHALKTPLAVMAQAAYEASAHPGKAGTADELAGVVQHQVRLARQQVDWHLSRARVSAVVRVPGLRCRLDPVVNGLMKVMERVHAERELRLQWTGQGTALIFAGEEQDLQEMLGNLLDNACKWARTIVRVSVDTAPGGVTLVVEDDGPGIPEASRHGMLARGVRLDESMPGSGLGLAIVADLAALYGGHLALLDSPLGGLAVRLTLPSTRS